MPKRQIKSRKEMCLAIQTYVRKYENHDCYTDTKHKILQKIP